MTFHPDILLFFKPKKSYDLADRDFLCIFLIIVCLSVPVSSPEEPDYCNPQKIIHYSLLFYSFPIVQTWFLTFVPGTFGKQESY